MYILEWLGATEASKYITLASEIARHSTCKRSKCGSIIVKDSEIIWIWYNSPAQWLESQRRCTCEKDAYDKKVTDKTCCIHAEQRAIMDALSKNPQKILGSRLYFVRLDDSWMAKTSWDPYCTICSKMSLDVWIKEFVLWRKEWFCVYDTQEYNDLSYKYNP